MDFILRVNGRLLPIQVTFTLEGTFDREVKSLTRVAKSLGARNGLVVTWEEEDEMLIDGIAVRVVPLWKFLTGFNPFSPT